MAPDDYQGGSGWGILSSLSPRLVLRIRRRNGGSVSIGRSYFSAARRKAFRRTFLDNSGLFGNGSSSARTSGAVSNIP